MDTDTDIRQFKDSLKLYRIICKNQQEKVENGLRVSRHSPNQAGRRTRSIVASTLSAAIDPENLFIEGDLKKLHDLSGSMSAILVGYWFTKLRSLILAKKSFEGYDLLEFSSEIHHC